jgi:hypothetical protein
MLHKKLKKRQTMGYFEGRYPYVKEWGDKTKDDKEVQKKLDTCFLYVLSLEVIGNIKKRVWLRNPSAR